MTAFSLTANSARIPGGIGGCTEPSGPVEVGGIVWTAEDASADGASIGLALALESIEVPACPGCEASICPDCRPGGMSHKPPMTDIGAADVSVKCEACPHTTTPDPDCSCRPDPLCVCGQVAS